MVNVIIVVLAVLGYAYLQTLQVTSLRPAEFSLRDLFVHPDEVYVDEPVTVSVNVTNIGDEAGNYTVTLIFDGEPFENRTVSLRGGEFSVLEFSVVAKTEGNHTVAVGNLTAGFRARFPTLPDGIKVSDMLVRPYEVWTGETVRITAKVTNENSSVSDFTLYLEINGTKVEGRSLHLAIGEKAPIEFTFTPEVEGIHYVKLGTARGAFRVVPKGMHTLSITSSPPGVEFTVNGKTAKTPYSELLQVGTICEVTMPKEHAPSRTQPTWQFKAWEDGSTDPIRRITIQNYTSVVATYHILASCPALHVWNGTDYIYITEVSDGTGYLGILDYFKEDGSIVFAYSYPWDYIKLERVKPVPKEGFYDFIFVQKADEIFYMDSVTMIAVDHPEDVEVYSTKATYIYNLEGQGKIYTVGKNLLTPVSAVNGKGENVLPLISRLDGVYTEGNEFQWDTLELNLGDLSRASEIKLVVAGTIFYSPGDTQGAWAARFIDQPGVKPFPPPYMEVKDENGNWIPVPDSRQFPLCDVGTDIFIVDLTGLFPTNDYSLRIHTFFDTRFDFIGIDTTPQRDIIIREVKPAHAYLSQALPTNSTSSGNFTKYGDVTKLVLEADDMFVIGRQGDQLQVL
ncbi:MAG: CARDB domain-containing protein, partial [Candidatus Bathyarchaeia archaeon]